jgi:hypothetical protein
MQAINSVPVVQVRSKSLLLYNHIVHRKPRETRLLNLRENFRQAKTYSGEVTNSSKKRITKAISLLNQMSPWREVYNPVSGRNLRFKLAFMTLTIPDDTPISASQAYEKLLKPFLRVLKRRHQVHHYVWKAELQERGQIHWHITMNQFVPMHYVQDEWNKIIVGAGFADQFHSTYGHWNPPSTEIKSVKKVKDIERYLVKYCTKKNSNGISLEGKVWGCSETIKAGSYFTELLDNSLSSAIDRCIEAKKAIAKFYDHFTIILFDKLSPLSCFSFSQINRYHSHFQEMQLMRC